MNGKQPYMPEQLALFKQPRRPVSWLMRRWGASRDKILRMLQRGDIAGFRLHSTANWEIDEEDVLEYEARLQEEVQSVKEERGKMTKNGDGRAR